MQNEKKTTVKWRRFSRTPFAIFQSIRREVHIGVLAVAMLGSVSLKAEEKQGASFSQRAEAFEEDSLTVALEDVEVLASRVPLTALQAPRLVTVLSAADIAAAAVHSISDLLEYSVGVDVRQRGEFGVQTDISVRGGTFDQITILLNGINISSPQTGHHSADFPVSVQDIERVEVLEGPCARVFGTTAFTGVINIVTKKGERDGSKASGEVRLVGGSYGYAGGDFSVHSAQNHSLSGGYSRSDGATPNSDFSSARGFYQGEFDKNDLRLNVQFGYSYKQYGANTFYGAASTDQWESNEHYIGSISFEDKIGNLHFSASANWNRWFDHYQWHKNNPAGENFHKVDAVGGTVNAWFESRLGKTSFGVETRYEGLYSTKLGELLDEKDWKKTQGHDRDADIMYKYHADRVNYSAFAEHDILLDHWTLSLGMLANRNTALDSRWRFYPGVDVSFRPNTDWRIFASWNMALRMPTYTDLYYSGNNIIGTRAIEPEQTNDVSLGTRFRKMGWKAEASIFYSHKNNMIDWVIYADEPDQQTFRSGNFTLDNCGTEIAVTFLPRELFPDSPLRKFSLQYAYIDEHIAYTRPILSSKYAMEYLRHKIVVSGESRICQNVVLSLSWRFQERSGLYNNPYALLDGKIVWNLHSFSTFLDCSNILNKAYFDYSYIPQPKRWAKIGLSMLF